MTTLSTSWNLRDVPEITQLRVNELPRGKVYRFWMKIISDPLGNPIQMPIMVARGKEEGKVLGITAAVHGNELNGIPVIQRFFKNVDVENLRGTIVGVPTVNIVSLVRKKRRFIDGVDLNHIMPGKKDGNVSQVFAYRFFHRVVQEFDYLIDLHTASFGRINSYYIRADMEDETTARMALLQNADIIVHNPPSDGTLRGAAEAINIPAITLEVGDPNTFQKGMIRSSLTGIYNVCSYFGLLPKEKVEEPSLSPIICTRSYWTYTDKGGILRVLPHIRDFVKKGECIAILENIFGDLIQKYYAPEDGVVIGKSVNPINQSGGRILHLGIPE